MTNNESAQCEMVQTETKKRNPYAGRATRSEFWKKFFFWFGIKIVMGILMAAIPPIFIVSLVLDAIAMVAMLRVSTRRLHDFNFSGYWMVLLVFVPLINIIILGCISGTKGDNKYGADPRMPVTKHDLNRV